MDPPASPATPTAIDPLIFLIVFGFVTLVFCCLLWECYRCLSSTLAAASSDPFEAEPVLAPVRVPARSKSVPIEQVMPSFVVQIGSNGHEVASKSGGGGGGEGGEGEGKCCAICLEEFKDGELCRMFPKCNHEFHGPCVNDWLLRQNLTCPLCRNSLEDLVLAINV